MYVRAITAEQINAAVTAETVNNHVDLSGVFDPSRKSEVWVGYALEVDVGALSIPDDSLIEVTMATEATGIDRYRQIIGFRYFAGRWLFGFVRGGTGSGSPETEIEYAAITDQGVLKIWRANSASGTQAFDNSSSKYLKFGKIEVVG